MFVRLKQKRWPAAHVLHQLAVLYNERAAKVDHLKRRILGLGHEHIVLRLQKETWAIHTRENQASTSNIHYAQPKHRHANLDHMRTSSRRADNLEEAQAQADKRSMWIRKRMWKCASAGKYTRIEAIMARLRRMQQTIWRPHINKVFKTKRTTPQYSEHDRFVSPFKMVTSNIITFRSRWVTFWVWQ